MVVIPYKVYVVADGEFGGRLAALPVGVPVWIVRTPVNRSVAERLRIKAELSQFRFDQFDTKPIRF